MAYNVWVSSAEVARRVAPLVRGPEVRALGLAVGTRAQVSCNLVDPDRYGPAQLYDRWPTLTGELGGRVEGGELVGLIPEGSWPPCPPTGEPSSACRRRRRWSPGSLLNPSR